MTEGTKDFISSEVSVLDPDDNNKLLYFREFENEAIRDTYVEIMRESNPHYRILIEDTYIGMTTIEPSPKPLKPGFYWFTSERASYPSIAQYAGEDDWYLINETFSVDLETLRQRGWDLGPRVEIPQAVKDATGGFREEDE